MRLMLDNHQSLPSPLNNKWDFYVARASLNLSARVAKSSIYFCEQYSPLDLMSQNLKLNGGIFTVIYA